MKSLAQVALASLVLVVAAPAFAQEPVWRTGVSLMGEPKYQDGFTQFDYVNPDAPKGGAVRLSDTGSFDTFNPLLPKGELAAGLGLIYESLMTSSMDETSTQYGAIANALSYPDDFSSVTFRLDPDARWHDGQPITPDDVIWSFNTAIALSPRQANYYANVSGAEAIGTDQVKFTFSEKDNRELPQIMGQLLVLPKHWWEATGPNGQPRDIGASTLEKPLGSGPYELAEFVPGTSVTYRRVEDYWGKNKPENIGQNNFDEITYEFFRDTDVQFEAFKADQFDWWDENRAARWATGYDFPAVNDGRVVMERFEEPYRSSGVMVAFVMNTRLDKFKDARVRKAFNYAFDFEELSANLFFGQYERINSYFYGTDLASSGLPEGEELEILNSVRDLVPPTVFTEPYVNPVNGDAGKLRANLAAALRLLTEAGYTLQGNQLVDAAGQQLSFEILLPSSAIEPVATNIQTNLRKIGIDVSIKTADYAQYLDLVRTRDFEVAYTSWTQSLSPGNEQRNFWGSQAADEENSENYAGIKDPAVDALIDKIIFADDRETLVAATHALDRVLLANSYVIPSYALRNARIARWDRFSHPEVLPEFAIGFPTIWWYDEAKAAKTGGPN